MPLTNAAHAKVARTSFVRHHGHFGWRPEALGIAHLQRDEVLRVGHQVEDGVLCHVGVFNMDLLCISAGGGVGGFIISVDPRPEGDGVAKKLAVDR